LSKKKRIILFRSFSRGDYHENSDTDLIIMGDFSRRFFDRIGIILDLVPSDLYIEPLVYTKEEFNKMSENGNPFILTEISDGLNLI
jgi:predicted nucleotidyltransferase